MALKDVNVQSPGSDAAQAPRSPRLRRNNILLAGGVLLVVALVAVALWYFVVQVPHNEAAAAFSEAVEQYDAAVDDLNARTHELDSAIAELQAVIDSDAQPLDPTLLTNASAAIGEAQSSKADAPASPEHPESTQDIQNATDDMPALTADVERLGDYSAPIASLKESQAALEASIAQLAQVTNPDEAFVIGRIKGLPTIAGVQAVTEEHDPNGNLNKQGGYTAALYLASTLVDQASVLGNDIVDKGTDAGGAVEVYSTADDAGKRNAYLGAFDGSILASGSHAVVGTVVIRTSNKLTASQQTELETAIREALTRLN
ncbi:hypothetical protein [Microbacterium rhizophilus]|uniref:hypothetical protein n=1 Tax=Microbacterium rhizophilus TaxID=3138934 RepID=UPI0031F0F89C